MTSSTKIRLLAMGGTIAFGPSDHGSIPQLTASDLSAGVAHVDYLVETLDIANTSSIALRGIDLMRLVAHVHVASAGVVVTHGTDAMEATAYFLALRCPRSIPIVPTGAMRPSGAVGFDGPKNLRDALAVARLPLASGLGPLVVMNDGIHAGRFVSKVYATLGDAFGSPTAGPVGQRNLSEKGRSVSPLRARPRRERARRRSSATRRRGTTAPSFGPAPRHSRSPAGSDATHSHPEAPA